MHRLNQYLLHEQELSCFYVVDPKGCLHVVGHDLRDTQELDPGSDEERASS